MMIERNFFLKNPISRQNFANAFAETHNLNLELCHKRVRMVAKRAGGLTEARLEDVRAGRKKNKDTSIYSGDALKTKEITEGSFIVEALTGGSDSLGALGDFSCSHCGALRFCQISVQQPDLSAFCKIICQVEARDQPFHVLPGWHSDSPCLPSTTSRVDATLV